MAQKSSFLVALVWLALGLRAVSAGEFADNLTWDDDAKVRASHAAVEGKRMQPLLVINWINGQVKPDDLKGKVVVLDFYATWCGPCMAAIPHNNELLKTYKDQGLVLVGICTSSRGQETFAANAKQHGIEYPAARDSAELSEKAYAVQYYPTYVLIDRKGIVRVVGLQPQNVEDAVKKLLAEPAA